MDQERDVFKLTVGEVSGLLRKMGLEKVRGNHVWVACAIRNIYVPAAQAFAAKFREDNVNGVFLMSMQEDWLEPYVKERQLCCHHKIKHATSHAQRRLPPRQEDALSVSVHQAQRVQTKGGRLAISHGGSVCPRARDTEIDQ